jgi:hypothetical protein
MSGNRMPVLCIVRYQNRNRRKPVKPAAARPPVGAPAKAAPVDLLRVADVNDPMCRADDIDFIVGSRRRRQLPGQATPANLVITASPLRGKGIRGC